MARPNGAFLNDSSSPVRLRVPSGNTTAEMPPRITAAARSYASKARARLKRSIATWPAASIARPSSGTFTSSCFATKRTDPGSTAASAQMSNMEEWLEAYTTGCGGAVAIDAAKTGDLLERDLDPDARRRGEVRGIRREAVGDVDHRARPKVGEPPPRGDARLGMREPAEQCGPRTLTPGERAQRGLRSTQRARHPQAVSGPRAVAPHRVRRPTQHADVYDVALRADQVATQHRGAHTPRRGSHARHDLGRSVPFPLPSSPAFSGDTQRNEYPDRRRRFGREV